MANWVRLWAKRLKRLPLHIVLRNLARWKPLKDPAEGYTIIMGCMKAMAAVAIANLRQCALMKCPRLHEMVLVFDCPASEIPASVQDAVREISPSLKIRVFSYSKWQCWFAHLVNWPWIYSWLSWCVALGQVRTRAVIVHDLDALPMDPGLFEQIYHNWLDSKAEFCGIRWYVGNGVIEEMHVVTTFELALDAVYVRERFRPFDLFNKLHLVDGRLVDFDTMLYAQWTGPPRAACPILETQLVHPSQLITQYTDLVAGRSNFRGKPNLLPILLYFLYLGGDEAPLTAAGPLIAKKESDQIQAFGRSAFIDGTPPEGWAWMEKQIRRVEQICFNQTRPAIEDYLRGFIWRSGDKRTVGRETGETAVAER